MVHSIPQGVTPLDVLALLRKILGPAWPQPLNVEQRPDQPSKARLVFANTPEAERAFALLEVRPSVSCVFTSVVLHTR